MAFNLFASTLLQAVKANVPILVSGGVGVGKSAGAVQAFYDAGYDVVEVLILALREPVDLLGAMLTNPVAGESAVLPPAWAVRLSKATKGVLIFDEFSTAAVAMQHACLRIINERYVGDVYLDPARIAIVGLTNPAAIAQGHEMTLATGTRWLHVNHEINVVEFVSDFASYWGKTPAIVTSAGTVPAEVYTEARTRVAKFLKAKPELIAPQPEDPDAQQGIFTQPFPNPRTWDAVARLIAVALHEGRQPADQYFLAEGLVGKGAAHDLFSFLEQADMPDPEDLLADPASYRHPARSDRARTITLAVATACAANPTPQRWLAAWSVLGAAARAGGPDVAANAARVLSEIDSTGLPYPAPEDRAPFRTLFAVQDKLRGDIAG